MSAAARPVLVSQDLREAFGQACTQLRNLRVVLAALGLEEHTWSRQPAFKDMGRSYPAYCDAEREYLRARGELRRAYILAGIDFDALERRTQAALLKAETFLADHLEHLKRNGVPPASPRYRVSPASAAFESAQRAAAEALHLHDDAVLAHAALTPVAPVAVDELDLETLDGALVLAPEDDDSRAIAGESLFTLEGAHG